MISCCTNRPGEHSYRLYQGDDGPSAVWGSSYHNHWQHASTHEPPHPPITVDVREHKPSSRQHTTTTSGGDFFFLYPLQQHNFFTLEPIQLRTRTPLSALTVIAGGMQLWVSQQGALKPMLRFMVKQRLGPTGGGKPAAEASLNWTKQASPSNYGKRGRGGGRLETWFGYGPFGCWTDEPVPAEESSGAAPERKLQNKPRSVFFFFFWSSNDLYALCVNSDMVKPPHNKIPPGRRLFFTWNSAATDT